MKLWMNFREDEPDGGLPPKKRRFGKRRVDDAMHGPLGTVRPDGEKNYFSEERLQEFYIKDLIEAKHHEVLFFYRELLAITLTLLFVLILALANGAKIL